MPFSHGKIPSFFWLDGMERDFPKVWLRLCCLLVWISTAFCVIKFCHSIFFSWVQSRSFSCHTVRQAGEVFNVLNLFVSCSVLFPPSNLTGVSWHWWNCSWKTAPFGRVLNGMLKNARLFRICRRLLSALWQWRFVVGSHVSTTGQLFSVRLWMFFISF